jgi:hypothetical protein
MTINDWTALRRSAAVALERSNQPTASTEVFYERDVDLDAEKCGVCPRFFLFELDLTWDPGYIRLGDEVGNLKC